MGALRGKLQAKEFVTTAEIAPPKGTDVDGALTTASKLSCVDAINVTDNQGACMRMAPLALGRILIENGHEPILQVTCRDRNRMGLQSDLLGAAALGLENLLLLTGDHPRFGDHTAAKPVFDLDSVQLLKGVRDLQSGVDMSGNCLTEAPVFLMGAAAAPTAQPHELVMSKVKKKISCGADFFQTQAVFQRDLLERFMGDLSSGHPPVVLGVLLLKSVRMAEFLNRQIPGVQVSEALLRRLEVAEDPFQEGVRIAQEMVGWARDMCQGVHLMTFGREDLVPEILNS